MILIIAEKPQLGEAIADALPGKTEKKDGVIRKGDYVITWAFGHLLTLKYPEDYDEKYKKWELSDLPIYFEPWGNKPGASKQGQTSKAARLKQIGSLLKDADMVIHAGDIDEEGQLLIDEILRWYKYKGPVKRLDTSNTAVAAMKKALSNLKDNKSFEADGLSAYGRELSDAIFGFNLTRYYSIKSNSTMHIGRVQTPTLGLVVRRDELIEKHSKIIFYDLFANLNIQNEDINCKFIPCKTDPALDDGRVLDRTYLEGKERGLLSKRSFTNIRISKKEVKESPPLPFNLNKLNIYCSKKWGYDPDLVLQTTQALRDKYKAITYNRSDCQYLSEEHYSEAPVTVKVTCQNLGLNAGMFDTRIKSRCFNDANITAHFAIIPSGEKVDTAKLTKPELDIYTAISNFYLAQFMPQAIREKTILDLDLGNGESLHASGTALISPGYLSILSEAEDSDIDEDSTEENSASLCNLSEGIYIGQCTGTNIRQGETKPPARYTPATLENDMTRIAKYVDDPQIKQLLMAKDKDKKGENGSIGTSATRAAIVKNLVKHGLLSEKKKGKTTILISTDKGRALYNALPDNIKKADTTARWWVMQEDIKEGKETPEGMARNVLEEITAIIRSGGGQIDVSSKPDDHSLGECPLCGKPVIRNKNGNYSCTGRKEGCKFNIFGIILQKKLTDTNVRDLLSKGKTKKIVNFISKTGKNFDAALKLEPDGSLKFVFPDTPKKR